MVGLEHVLFVPEGITEEALHPPDRAALDPQHHRLDRLACEPTVLAYHIGKALGARLTPCKAVMADGLELLQCLDRPFHIAWEGVPGRNGKRAIWDAAREYYWLSPHAGSVAEEQRRELCSP